MPVQETIGERLRIARRNRDLSLETVASRLGVSVATLSRIETSKQGMDLPFFLTLASTIGIDPAKLIGSDAQAAEGHEGLVRQLAALAPDERIEVMVAAGRGSHNGHGNRRDLQRRLDGLLATIDLVREELVEIRRALRKRG